MELSRKILKLLKKLNEHFGDLVGPQFFANLRLPQALISYLENTELKDIAGDMFILFINIFDDDQTPPHITVGFIDKLMAALAYIDDDSTHDALVSILICMVPIFEKNSPDTSNLDHNPVLKEFIQK